MTLALIPAGLTVSVPGALVVPPAALLALEHHPARDVAASYFHPLAESLDRPGAPLVLPRWPVELPLGHRRMLQRTVLALGGVHLDPSSAGGSLAERWETTGRVGYDFPAYRAGALAELVGGAPLGWANRGPGAGAFRPGVALLVGERPGVAKSGQLKHRLPFVSFDGAGCAGWLAEQLASAEVEEADLYWVNAYDAVGVPTDAAFVRELAPSAIVALGSVAGRWCRDVHLRYRAAPHPQYWKRFHYRERYPLLDVLRATP